jgi:hypothetical protein
VLTEERALHHGYLRLNQNLITKRGRDAFSAQRIAGVRSPARL